MRQRQALAIILLSSCESLCRGQEQTAASPAAVQMKVVKGMPFSAKIVTESNQTLAGGNRILRTSTSLIARDSDGRTRREQTLAGTDALIIFIQDPVARVSYVLDTRDGSVRKIPIRTLEGVESPLNTGLSAETIGTQSIEGFVVEGSRLRQTIPADKAGSTQALEVTLETWYSPQLQTIVRNRTVDPRFGVVDYKLTEIQLGEPAQSLFELPKNYTVREEPEGFRSLVVEKAEHSVQPADRSH